MARHDDELLVRVPQRLVVRRDRLAPEELLHPLREREIGHRIVVLELERVSAGAPAARLQGRRRCDSASGHGEVASVLRDVPDRPHPAALLQGGQRPDHAEHRLERGEARDGEAEGPPFFERHRSRVVHGGLGGERSSWRRPPVTPV